MVAPATITVYDTIYDTAGNAVSGVTVTCVLNSSQETTSGGLIGPRQQSTQTVAGRFAFTVVCNDLLSPSGSTYTISTPFRTYDIAPQSANGSSQQTTAANVIVNVPTALQTTPSLSGTYSGPADFAIRSLTVLSSSPYTPKAAAGQAVFAAGPVYDVAAYGTFTGVDDTTTLLAVVAAAPANSIIWISQDPSGNPWVTNSALVISRNGVWFDGPGTIKLKNNGNRRMIAFEGVTGGGVRNIGLDGNKANNTANGDGYGNQGVIIGANGACTNISVENVRIQNTLNDGVYIKLSTKCQVESCYITACGTDLSGGSPIHLLQGCVDCQVIGNNCDANAYGINVESNNITNCTRVQVIGNVISNCFGAHGGYQQAGGISIQGCTYAVIQSNHCYGATTIRGIYLAPGYSASSSDYALIEGNHCANNNHNGIDLTGNFLKVIGNHSEYNGESGIFLSGNPLPIDTTNCIVIGNTCRNNGQLLGVGSKSQAGIVMNYTVPGDITDNIIAYNSCVDNGTGSQLYGILEWTVGATHYARNIIVGNQLQGNATAGLSLQATTDIVFNNGLLADTLYQATPDLRMSKDPQGLKSVAGNAGDKIALYGTAYGIGVQAGQMVLFAPAVAFAQAPGGAGAQSAGAATAVMSATGTLSTYKSITTAGIGVSTVYASYRNTALVAAVANAINYTPPAAAGSYRLRIHYRPTATGASTSVGVTVTYKDSTGAISITTLPFVRRSTSTVVPPPFLNSGAEDYYADFPFEIDASATAITVSTTGTFTGTTYNLSVALEQLA